MNIQDFRDLTRPIITLTLVGTLCLLALTALYCVCFTEVEVDKILKITGIIDTPVGMILTYHFIKSSKIDTT